MWWYDVKSYIDIKRYFDFTVTFEDKKRENFERGNLELEKRRQALQEQQRKEQERLAALEREEQERKVNLILVFLKQILYQTPYNNFKEGIDEN